MRSSTPALFTAAAVALAGAVGCTSQGAPTAAPDQPPSNLAPTTTRSPVAGPDCPPTSTRHGGGITTIDYVDFVQANGRNYIADLHRVPAISQADLGPRVLTVRCSFSQLNDRTGASTPTPRDGDAAFLAPGTPVYAIRGWPPNCRLAARHDGRLHVYLAYRPGGKVATPERCALRHGA